MKEIENTKEIMQLYTFEKNNLKHKIHTLINNTQHVMYLSLVLKEVYYISLLCFLSLKVCLLVRRQTREHVCFLVVWVKN